MQTRRPRVIRRSALAVMLTAALGSGLAGCNDYLTGTKLRHNPNDPSTAGLNNLFTSIQINTTTRLEDQLARTVCIWMQQCAGQIPPFNSIGQYAVGEDDYYTDWAGFYGSGGLIDMHTVQSKALQIGDSIYAGQAAVLEALLIGTAADVWGDIPYSQAGTPATTAPALDSQRVVYESLEKKLATAVGYLGATGPTNSGAGAVDLVYGGAPAKWMALANTLRARLFLHMAPRVGTAAYDSAAAAASAGIAAGGDYVSVNNSSAQLSNLWNQFSTIYAGNIVAGKFLVDLMNGEPGGPDPRLPQYFDPNSVGAFAGADPGVTGGDFSPINTAVRTAPAFPQPFVTYAENELIQAEADVQTGNAAGALTHLNNELTAAGAPPATTATLQTVMTEKYIAEFQNIEVWSDWRRTGIPALVPYKGGTIPRRLVYPLSERNANKKIVGPGPARNWNDPGP
jgi:hypothetical protein